MLGGVRWDVRRQGGAYPFLRKYYGLLRGELEVLVGESRIQRRVAAKLTLRE
jgi:hypothetical protein